MANAYVIITKTRPSQNIPWAPVLTRSEYDAIENYFINNYGNTTVITPGTIVEGFTTEMTRFGERSIIEAWRADIGNPNNPMSVIWDYENRNNIVTEYSEIIDGDPPNMPG